MSKIETLEQLQAEQLRLRGIVKEMEASMQEDFGYFSHKIQVVTSIVDKFKTGSSVLAGGLGAVLPLLLNRKKSSTAVPGGLPSWLTVAEMLGGYLVASELGQKLMGKLKHLFSKFAHRSKDNETDEAPTEEPVE